MKSLIVIVILAAAVGATPTPTPAPVQLDIRTVNQCVARCGQQTILMTDHCLKSYHLYWTPCLVECCGIEGVGPKANSCVDLHHLQGLLEKLGS